MPRGPDAVRPAGEAAPDDRCDFAGRMLHEVNDTNSAVATAVGTSQAGFRNVLAVAQFAGRQPSGLNYALDAAFTDTGDVTDPGVPQGDGWHYAGSLGWKGDHPYVKAEGDRYDRDYFPADALLESDLPGTQGAALTVGYYRETVHPAWRVLEAYAGAKYRETTGGERQSQKACASAGVEAQIDVRATLFLEEGPYRPVTAERGVFSSTRTARARASTSTSSTTMIRQGRRNAR